MSKQTIVAGLLPRSKQSGFSVVSYLAGIVVAGVITSTMLPAIRSVVDTADYNALAHARSVLNSAISVNHQLSRLRGSDHIVIDGTKVPLRFGYPFASAESLRSFASFDGFDIEESQHSARIWSPGRLFCITYMEPMTAQGAKSRPEISEIVSAADGDCA